MFEKLYTTSYKFSGLSIATYNKLIGAGTVINANKYNPELFKKSLCSPDKLFQIISGKVLINLVNGTKVKLREGDFINDKNWNFNTHHDVRTFIVDYSILSDTLLISWPYSRLTDLLQGPDRRLFSYLLLSNLNSLLLRFTDLTNDGIIRNDDVINQDSDVTYLNSISLHENMSNHQQPPRPSSSNSPDTMPSTAAQSLLLHEQCHGNKDGSTSSSSRNGSDNGTEKGDSLIYKTSRGSSISCTGNCNGHNPDYWHSKLLIQGNGVPHGDGKSYYHGLEKSDLYWENDYLLESETGV